MLAPRPPSSTTPAIHRQHASPSLTRAPPPADKRTGLLLRAPYLANVLEQPFTSTSLMSRMARQAEEHVKALVGATLESLPRRSPPQPAERTADEGTIFRRVCCIWSRAARFHQPRALS